MRPAASRAARSGAVRGLGERSGGGGHCSRAEEIALAADVAEQDYVGPMTASARRLCPSGSSRMRRRARACSTLNEGPSGTLWFGVGDDESIARLRFFRDDLGPRLARMLERRGPIDVFGLAAQGLNMGDELHMRSQAANLLIRDGPALAVVGEEAARFEAPTTTSSLNGDGRRQVRLAGDRGLRRLGRRLADLAQRHRRRHPARRHAGRWFVAEAAPVADALLRESNGADDAARDIGDSAVIRSRRSRRHGARRGARGRLLLRRRRRGAAADGADGRDLLGALGALHDHRPGLRRHAGGHRRSASSSSWASRRRLTTGVLHAHAGTGRSAPGWRISRSSRSRAAIAALAASLDDG